MKPGEGRPGPAGLRRLIIRRPDDSVQDSRPLAQSGDPGPRPVPAFPSTSYSGDAPRFPTAARGQDIAPPAPFRRRSAAPPGSLRSLPARADQRPLPADDSAAPSPGSRPACPWPPVASRAGSHPAAAPHPPRDVLPDPARGHPPRPPRSALKGRARSPSAHQASAGGRAVVGRRTGFRSGGARHPGRDANASLPPIKNSCSWGTGFVQEGQATAGRQPRTWNGADHENGTEAFRRN